MRQINDFENVKAKTGNYERPGAGGYVVEIVNAVDVPMNNETGKGDYLRIEYDIADGEFACYYQDLYDKFGGRWKADFMRSYKETALGMFKHFVNCLEESNPGFRWNWNEKDLLGLRLGVVLREEEYIKNDGGVGKRLKVCEVKTVDQIENGDFTVPSPKLVSPIANVAPNYSNVKFEDVDGDLPF